MVKTKMIGLGITCLLLGMALGATGSLILTDAESEETEQGTLTLKVWCIEAGSSGKSEYDSNGALIGNMKVSIMLTDGGFSKTLDTSSHGNVAFDHIPRGVYEIKGEKRVGLFFKSKTVKTTIDLTIMLDGAEVQLALFFTSKW